MKNTCFFGWLSLLLLMLEPGGVHGGEVSLADRLSQRSVFPDPLNYVSFLPPADSETQPLWDFAESLTNRPTVRDQLTVLEGFVQSHPNSPWTPSLRANLASYYRKQGYFSQALAHWEGAWAAVKNSPSPGAKSVGDFVLGNWTEMLAKLGDSDRLGQLLSENGQRSLDGGPWQVRFDASKEAWGKMVANPKGSFRCGLAALLEVAKVITPDGVDLPRLREEQATEHGLSLGDLARLAQKYHLPLSPVELPSGADLPVPSVVHYRLGHFASILRQDGSNYLLSEPIFGQTHWLTRDAVLAETSGRFLVMNSKLPSIARPLTAEEQQRTIGRGYPNVINDQLDSYQPMSGAPGGLVGWRVSEPFLNLWLQASVVSYPQAAGGNSSCNLVYRQRNGRSNSGNFNFGPSWECSWLSYVDYDGGSYSISDIYVPQGGVNGYDGGTGLVYNNQSTLTASPFGGGYANYYLRNPDGTTLIYNYQQSFALNQNRAYPFLMFDRYGRATVWSYGSTNGTVYLTSLTDYNGQVSRPLYQSTTAGRVTAFVDPFGHTNTLAYNTTGYLIGITNALGFGSTMTYDGSGAVTNLSTPYGSTGFTYNANTNTGNVVNRSMLVALPTGGAHLYAYRDQSTYLNTNGSVPLLPFSYPTNVVPSTSPLTNTLDNTWMDARNSFYWSPRTYAQLSPFFLSSGNFTNLSTNDYLLARVRHWLRDTAIADTLSSTLSMERTASPDGVTQGQMTWFDYWGKSSSIGTNGGQAVTNWFTRGTNALPRLVALVLPDGATRFTYNEYNAAGNSTDVVSTWSQGQVVLLRTNRFVYDTNLVNLLTTTNAAGVRSASNLWSINQVIASYDALGERSVRWLQGNYPFYVAGNTAPNGLSTTNLFYTNGPTNRVQATMVPTFGFTNSFSYTNGQVYVFVNERGLSITNTYDALQRVVAVGRPDGTSWIQYTNALVSMTVDRLGNTNQVGYDAYGRKQWEKDALGRVTVYSYTVDSLIQSVTNALLQVTSFGYDNQGNILSTTYPDGTGVTNRYNLLGQLVVQTDAAGVALTNYYSNDGAKYAVSNSLGQVGYWQRDVLGQVTNTVDANGVTVATTYDAIGRVLTRRYPDGGTESFGYSPNIRGPTRYTNQLGKVTLTGYDLAGRVVATTNANDEIVSQSYGVSGELLSLTDGKGQTTRWGYDIYGRMVCRTNANGVCVLMLQYDSLGRVTNRWTSAKGNTAYAYDAVGNLLSVTHPVSPGITNQYDALNRVINRIDGLGITSYAFNNIGQLIQEDGPWSDDTITYADTVNNLLQSFSVAEPNASAWVQSYTYDGGNRIQSLSSPAGSFGYAYHQGLNGYISDSLLEQQISLPNGAYVTNTYDSVSRLLSTQLLTSGGTSTDSQAYAYNGGGQLTNVVRFDGSAISYQYDSVGQLTAANASESGGTPRLNEQFGYQYDAADNLAAKTNNALIQNVAVDALNQLVTVSRSGTLTVAGTTTANASTVTINGLAANRYGDATFALGGFALTNGNNPFTAIAGDALGRHSTKSVTANLPSSVGYIYDLNGNMLSDGLLGYAYDDDNQLLSITATNSWQTTFAYDGLGQIRVRTESSWIGGAWQVVTVTRYILVGGLVIQERNGNNIPQVSYTRRSGKGGGIGGLLARTDHGSQTHAYYHADGSGNVTTLINVSQAVVARYLYDPYGNTISIAGPLAQANTLRYASKELHIASGLVYFGARFYSPLLQRWLNADPIGESGGVNIHRYASNSPLVRSDSWGRDDSGGFDSGINLGGWIGNSDASPDGINSGPAWGDGNVGSTTSDQTSAEFRLRAQQNGQATYELDMYDYLGIIQDRSYWNSVQTEFVGIGSGIATGANGLWLSLTHPINTIDQVVTGFYAAVADFDGSARILISNLRQMWGQLTGGDPKVSGEKLGELVFAAGTAAVTGPVVGAAGEGIGAASRFVGGLIPEVEGVSVAADSAAIRWGPLNGPGPLGESVANTFRGGSYTESALSEDTTLYRVYGGNSPQIGPYWTRTAPTGPLQSTIDSALNPAWGNTAQNVTTMVVPKGTTIYEGFAAPQGGLLGGGSQVVIPTVNPAWLIKP